MSVTHLFNRVRSVACALAAAGGVAAFVSAPSQALAQADYVIHVTVDGLRPDAVTTLGPTQAPNFYRLRDEGAFTDNARTDYDYSITLPNHTSMLTGRPVNDQAAFGAQSGHRWTDNADATNPGPPATWPGGFSTIHQKAGYTVESAFNVANANGLSTGLYATKTKFLIYQQTYDPQIDRYVNSDESSGPVLTSFLGHMGSAATRNNYSFISFHDADSAGHDNGGWDLTPGSPYLNAVKAVDGYLGQILNLIDSDPALSGNTAIVLSADHGGSGASHSTASVVGNYTIPFYAWGAGVLPGDLYAMNSATRLNPGTVRPLYGTTNQPIRNGDGGNLALDLLGLGAIPGSFINANQSLAVPEPASAAVLFAAAGLALSRRRAGK